MGDFGSIFIGEMLGTMMLLLLGNGVVAGVLLNKSKSQNAGWIVITTGWAFAVLAGATTAFATGSPSAAINPAVSIGLVANGAIGFDQALVEIAGQMVGAFIGATLVWIHYYPHWAETDGADEKLACFSTGPAIRNPAMNLISEIIGTFVLMFVIFAFGAAHGLFGGSPTSFPFYLVACLVWGIGLSLGGTTGYAINPARDLGPRIAHAILPIAGKGDSDWSYSWIPVVGPLIGGAIAGLLATVLIVGA